MGHTYFFKWDLNLNLHLFWFTIKYRHGGHGSAETAQHILTHNMGNQKTFTSESRIKRLTRTHKTNNQAKTTLICVVIKHIYN